MVKGLALATGSLILIAWVLAVVAHVLTMGAS